MMTTIRILTLLRPFTDDNAQVSVAGGTAGAVLSHLTEQHPQLRGHLFDGDALRSFVNIYLNQEDVRYLNGAETEMSASDTLMIIPSITGGSINDD